MQAVKERQPSQTRMFQASAVSAADTAEGVRYGASPG